MEGLKFLRRLPEDELLARCIYGEARGEGQLGRIAVGCVVLNRRAIGTYGATIHSVILRPLQFSCFNKNDPNFIKLTQSEINDGAMAECREIARQLLADGVGDDPTNGATHYHAVGMRPYWADSPLMRFCRRIGNHLFYREIKR